MQDKKEIYYNYFQKNILPVIEPYEAQRRKTVKNVVISSLLFFVTGVIFAGLFIFNALYQEITPIIGAVFLLCMYIFILKSITVVIYNMRRYRDFLMEKVFPLFLVPIANFKEWPKNYNTETILDSKLFSNFDMQEDNYSYFGFYNNTNVIFSDTKLTLPTKGVVKPALFKGIIIQLELMKSINNHIILLSKNEHVCNHYKCFKTDIEELDRYLNVFAREKNFEGILTVNFWNVIKKLGGLYGAKGFALSYKDNVLLIGLRQKRPMRFGCLFKSLLKAGNYDELIERLIVLYELADVLNNI